MNEATQGRAGKRLYSECGVPPGTDESLQSEYHNEATAAALAPPAAPCRGVSRPARAEANWKEAFSPSRIASREECATNFTQSELAHGELFEFMNLSAPVNL
jgi:hypothetical protein